MSTIPLDRNIMCTNRQHSSCTFVYTLFISWAHTPGTSPCQSHTTTATWAVDREALIYIVFLLMFFGVVKFPWASVQTTSYFWLSFRCPWNPLMCTGRLWIFVFYLRERQDFVESIAGKLARSDAPAHRMRLPEVQPRIPLIPTKWHTGHSFQSPVIRAGGFRMMWV